MSFTVTGILRGKRASVTYNSEAHRLEGDENTVALLMDLLRQRYHTVRLGPPIPSPGTFTFQEHLRSPLSMLQFFRLEFESIEKITGDIPQFSYPWDPNAAY